MSRSAALANPGVGRCAQATTTSRPFLPVLREEPRPAQALHRLLRGRRRAVRHRARRLRARHEDEGGARASSTTSRSTRRRSSRRSRRAAATSRTTTTSHSSRRRCSSSRSCARFGFTDEAWRLDPTVHPFASGTGDRRHPDHDPLLHRAPRRPLRDDARVRPRLYEHQIDPALERSPLARGVSLGLHESQSRMWENLVGRSLPFWRHFFPRLQELFPDELARLRRRALVPRGQRASSRR